MAGLFDKKYVHFMWDDELEGKEGFFADDICELTNCVLGGDFHHAKVTKSLSPSFPFKDIVNSNDWQFFYHDPNYDCKRAYAEGKQIQIRHTPNSEWVDLNNETPQWHDCYEYRINPKEQKVRRMSYRELAEWLAKGNGQTRLFEGANEDIHISICDGESDKQIPTDYEIRRWGSDKWIEPTVDIYVEDCRVKAPQCC